MEPRLWLEKFTLPAGLERGIARSAGLTYWATRAPRTKRLVKQARLDKQQLIHFIIIELISNI